MGLSSGKCVSTNRLDGVTAVITGANSGIGKCTAQDFYSRGARVIMACRDVEKARKAVEEIREACKNSANVGWVGAVELDLGNLTSVRNCARNLHRDEARINLLVNNAGVMMCPKGKTADGFETQLGTNHFGHFLFTLLLLPKMMQSRPARIVNVSSEAHFRGHMDFDDLNWERRSYSALGAYAQSKLANILFTKELAARINDAGIENLTTYSVHPGIVATELSRHLDETYFSGLRWFLRNLLRFVIKTPEDGAQTNIYCSIADECANQTGLYYADCKIKQPRSQAKKMEDARKLWDLSWTLVGLPEGYNPFSPKPNYQKDIFSK